MKNLIISFGFKTLPEDTTFSLITSAIFVQTYHKFLLIVHPSGV
jgi:hypothetical protein